MDNTTHQHSAVLPRSGTVFTALPAREADRTMSRCARPPSRSTGRIRVIGRARP